MIKSAPKSKFFSAAMATLMAATVVATTLVTSPADAGRRERLIGAGVAAGVLGTLIVGGAVRRSRERRADRYYYRGHVNRCYARYRSYDERTDTWVDRYGRVRRCRL